MRMNVVLPLPLGPRKPQISPRADLQVDVIDGDAVAEPLGHAVHVDGEVFGHRLMVPIAHRPAGRDAVSRPASGSKTRSRS